MLNPFSLENEWKGFFYIGKVEIGIYIGDWQRKFEKIALT
jgi:hypothetical protein